MSVHMLKQRYHYFFRNLANPDRIKIIETLKKKESSVNKLSRVLGIEQSKLSHDLASLKCCRIVNVKKNGKHRIYSLNKQTIIPILKIIDKHEGTFCKTCSFEK